MSMPFARSAKGGLHTGLALVAITSLLLTGCTRGNSSATQQESAGSKLAADCASYEPTVGITDNSIKIGTSLPITGALATGGTVRYGAQAYFAKLNAEGGLNGRKIDYIVRDDVYDPSKTTTNVNELLNKDKIFATLGLFGTANIKAVQPDLQEGCVPDFLPLSGAPSIASPEQNWTVGLFPSYTLEAEALAKASITSGVKTVSVVSQNDDFGRAYVEGLKKGLEGSDVKITRELTYDVGAATVDAQVTQLADDKADAVMVAALGTKCPQILNSISASGWHPQLMVGALCTSKGLLSLLGPDAGQGLITTAWYKSPSDPAWADDEGMKEYRKAVQQYVPEADPNEDFVLNGWLMAQVFVELLKSSAELTRASVMEAAHNSDISVDSLLPGIKFKTSADRTEPISQLQVQRYDASTKAMAFLDPTTLKALPKGKVALTEVSR